LRERDGKRRKLRKGMEKRRRKWREKKGKGGDGRREGKKAEGKEVPQSVRRGISRWPSKCVIGQI